MLYSMPPLMGDKPKILILGTMPGGESLRLSQYFAYPQNRFWRIMFRYFGAELSDDYDTKSKLVKDNKISLWDTVKSCTRHNSSLDSRIKDVVYNDIPQLLSDNKSIKAVFCNSSLSAKFYQNIQKSDSFKAFQNVETVLLPSTSPANAAFSLDKLYTIWSQALDKYLK